MYPGAHSSNEEEKGKTYQVNVVFESNIQTYSAFQETYIAAKNRSNPELVPRYLC